MDIKWEAPPTRGGGEDHGLAQELRKQPGEWARTHEFDKPNRAGAVSQQIRAGQRAGFKPGGSFESVSRTVDGKGVVYTRFVGDASQD